MNRILFSFLFFITVTTAKAQNFHGQWKGYFIDKSASILSFGSDRSDYVLDLDVDDSIVTGYSYTYFSDGGHRYYTICTLKGIADKKTKRIQVVETERTKTNVPDNIANSFQVHTLSWRKDGDNEILEGTWKPAPGQGVNTGYGTTYLAKRQLSEISPLAKKVNALKDPENNQPAVNKPFAAKPATPVKKKPVYAGVKTPVKKPIPVAVKKPVTNPVAKTRVPVKMIAKTPTVAKRPVTNPVVKTPVVTAVKTEALRPLAAFPTTPVKDSIQKITPSTSIKLLPEKSGFAKRDNMLLQTVLVNNASVKVELYDSGEVDGDSISLFYNGKVLLAHRMLSEKPILLEIPVQNDEVNELVMYADNLGTIPPNTALMIVYDGTKRYEVRITSDLKQSGTIRFIHNSSAAVKP